MCGTDLSLMEYSNLEAVHDKLDSEGLKHLKEVRMALGPEGDGIVKEVRIEKLVNSVNDADLTLLERRLFEEVINALILNECGCKSPKWGAFPKGPSYFLLSH